MQLMPAIARQYGVQDSYDPHENLRAGATHLRSLLERYDGDLRLSLAAYNAGSGAVKRYRGVPPYRETQNYIRKIHDLLGGNVAGRQTPKRDRLSAAASPAPPRVVYAADGTISLVN
jgi:soluble lytic murein transglycosylase-like protein